MVANETANLNRYDNIITNIQDAKCSMIKKYINNINKDKHEFIISLAERYILIKENNNRTTLNMCKDNIEVSS